MMQSTEETKPAGVEAVQTFEGAKSGTMYTVPAADVTMTTKSVQPKSLKCVCIDDIVQFEKDEYKRYNCGRCRHKFITVCLLHEHLKLHGSGGSYHFDHVSNTAFPKYDTFCSFTQTDGNFFDERTEAPLASVSDQESNDELEEVDQGTSDHEDSDEPVTSLHDEEEKTKKSKIVPDKSTKLAEAKTHIHDNVSATTDQEVDSFRKAKTVASDGDTKVKTRSKTSCTPIKKAKVVLEDINDLLKGAVMKGLSKDVKLNGNINSVSVKDISALQLPMISRPPMRLRNGKHAEPKPSKSVTKKLEAQEREKPQSSLGPESTETGVDTAVRIERRGRKKVQKQIRKTVDEDPDYDIESDIDICEKDEILQDIAPVSRTLRKRKLPNDKSKQNKHKGHLNKKPAYIETFSDCEIDIDIDFSDMEDIRQELLQESPIKKPSGELRSRDSGIFKKELGEVIDIENELPTDDSKTLTEDAAVIIKLEHQECSLPSEDRDEAHEEEATDHADIRTDIEADNEEIEDDQKRKNKKTTVAIPKPRNRTGYKVKKRKYKKKDDDLGRLRTCDTCGKTIDKYRFKNHVIRCVAKKAKIDAKNEKLEEDNRLHKCETCKKMVPGKKLKRHMLRHAVQNALVICDRCGQSYTGKQMENHKMRCFKAKTLKCSFCPSLFCYKAELDAHEARHQDKPPFICNVCDKGYYKNCHLNKHMRVVHMGDKAYTCDICDKKFGQKNNLTEHRTIHFEPTLPCRFCQRMFRQEWSRNRHELIHTGKHKFQCHICDHKFIQILPYYAHMDKHHGLDRATVKKLLEKVYRANRLAGKRGGAVTMIPCDDGDSSVTSQLPGQATSTVDESATGAATSDVTDIVKLKHIVTHNSNSVAVGHKQSSTMVTKSDETPLTPHQQESLTAIQALQASQNQVTAQYISLQNTGYLP